MRIISINREFGSGGRELGQKLAKELGFDYYDREILASISQKHGLNPKYVENSLEKGMWTNTPLVFGDTFSLPSISADLLESQTNILLEIAALGRDCVIVGRNADTILAEYNPFKIFVYADLESKIKRCSSHKKEGEDFSDKQLIKKIKNIDENRIRTKELISGKKWGQSENYNLMINTSSCQISQLIPSLAAYCLAWFNNF